MKAKLPKILVLSFVVLGTITTGVVMWQCKSAIDALPELPPLPGAKHASNEEHGAPAKAEGHGEAKAEHGGGHGEAKKEGGHGEAPKAEGHGEAKAEGHGEAPKGEGHGEAKAEGHGGGEGGHGEAARAPASKNSLPLFTIDELYVNVASQGLAHTLGLKLELEMFEEKSRSVLDSRQAAIRNKIIESAREQEYTKLGSLAGKLYFKEVLVSHLNEYFQQPLIKDIHFSLFYLQ